MWPEFSFSTQQIWKVIKENKDLDLPAHKVMVATVHCDEIANEKFFDLTANEEWCLLEEVVKSGSNSGFGNKLNSVLEICLLKYDTETDLFDEGVRTSKRQQLDDKVLHPVQLATIRCWDIFGSGLWIVLKKHLIRLCWTGKDLP
ncbi:hypothetical protein GIB67_009022 [Kingdonia uniflora]|uniref:Sey1/RHD3-like three-helix bundle domain-containing protein n=1 Tax=Kingdonia uniflora TaxID=39325 RepID=A0A7J7LVR8_9MAGN|nr:hypothetical protein GIB67_009022 [Kingdonia uniflora]